MYPFVRKLSMYIPTTWFGTCHDLAPFDTPRNPARTPSLSRLPLGTRLVMRSDISTLLITYEKVKVRPPID